MPPRQMSSSKAEATSFILSDANLSRYPEWINDLEELFATQDVLFTIHTDFIHANHAMTQTAALAVDPGLHNHTPNIFAVPNQYYPQRPHNAAQRHFPGNMMENKVAQRLLFSNISPSLKSLLTINTTLVNNKLNVIRNYYTASSMTMASDTIAK